jgi:hypothetical protein
MQDVLEHTQAPLALAIVLASTLIFGPVKAAESSGTLEDQNDIRPRWRRGH